MSIEIVSTKNADETDVNPGCDLPPVYVCPVLVLQKQFYMCLACLYLTMCMISCPVSDPHQYL